MSYLLDEISTVSRTPQVAQLSVSGSEAPLTATSTLEFTTTADQTYNGFASSLLSIVNSDTLRLGSGYWFFQGFLGVKNSNALNNHVTYQFELDGTLIGTQGACEISNKSSLDDASCCFFVEQGTTKDLKLKLTDVTYASGTLETFDEYTSVLIDYVSI